MRSGAQWDSPAGDTLMAVFAAPTPAGLKREVVYFDPNDGAPAERAGPPEGGRSITGKGWTVTERPIPADIDRVAMIFNRGARGPDSAAGAPPGSDLAHLRRHQRRFAGRRLSADLRSPRCRRPIDIDPRRSAGAARKAPAPARPTCTKSTRSPGRPELLRIGLTSRASGRSSRPPPSSRCWRRCGYRRARRRRPASCSARLAEGTARRIPYSLTIALDGAVKVPLRSEPSAPSRPLEFRLTTEEGQSDRRARGGRRRQAAHARGRSRDHRARFRSAAAADRPASVGGGWRRLRADHCAAGGLSRGGCVAAPLRRRRAAICAAATAGRSGDRRFHDPRPRRRRGRRQRRRLSRRQPDARAVSLGSQPREPL